MIFFYTIIAEFMKTIIQANWIVVNIQAYWTFKIKFNQVFNISKIHFEFRHVNYSSRPC